MGSLVSAPRRNAARSVGDDVHIIAFAHRVDSGHRKTYLRPECCNDKFLAARLLDCLDDTAVLPRIDEGAVDRLLIRKYRLDLLENLTAAFRADCCENRRHAVRLCRFCESCDVVDHHCRQVTVLAPPAFLMTNLYCPSFSGVTLTEHFGPGESSLATSAPEES